MPSRGRIPKDECGHYAAMVVTYYDRHPIYWCPRCERHVQAKDLKKVKTRGT